MIECLHQLDIYQPWAQTFEHFMSENEGDIEEGFAKTANSWAECIYVTEGIEHAKLARLGSPSDGKFNHLWTRESREITLS